MGTAGAGNNYKLDDRVNNATNPTIKADRPTIDLRAAKVAKAGAEALIAAACIFWAAWWFVSPEPDSDPKYVEAWIGLRAKSRFFRTDGREGSTLIYQAMPFVVVTALSFAVIELRKFINARSRINYRGLKWQLSTYPLWVDRSPVGIVTAAELVGIVAITLLMTYHFGRIIHIAFTHIDHNKGHQHGPPVSKAWQKVNFASFYFGRVAVLPFSLLWIPVSRGSPLLRLAGIPFERAVRYHIWLSVCMIVLVSLHSVGYILLYVSTGRAHLIYGWVTSQEKCSVVAGLVAWLLGLLMWATSLSFVRRRFYDVFFSVHHLYLLFTLFWLYHAVWNYFFFVIPVLLFFVDRFLRMVQSASLVHVSSAKLLDSGAIELNLPVHAHHTRCSAAYNALSAWCIQIPGISKLQWHFFSGTSSPLDSTQRLSIIIKPLGGWTNDLRDQFLQSRNNAKSRSSAADNSSGQPATANNYTSCPFSFKARVEGPYGDESDFYLKYKSLVLVTGGIGITPALAIIRDILYRHKHIMSSMTRAREHDDHLPTSITLYHCVRTAKELCVLNSLNPNQILPGYHETSGLRIHVHVYITSKNAQDYQDLGSLQEYVEDRGADHNTRYTAVASSTDQTTFDLSKFTQAQLKSQPIVFYPPVNSAGPGKYISSIGSTGSTAWVAGTTMASILGYFVLSGLANVFIIRSYKRHTFPNYNRAHVVVACMFLGIFVFGGLVVLLWLWKVRRSSQQQKTSINSVVELEKSHDSREMNTALDRGAAISAIWDGDVRIFSRPNWKDVFDGLVQEHDGECVGVLVSGSDSMLQDIARECKRCSPFNVFTDISKSEPKRSTALLHFHSISFNF